MVSVSKAQDWKSVSLVPISPATLVLSSRRLELLVASTEAVSGGKSVDIRLNLVESVAFLGYKAGPSLKMFRHCFIQHIPSGDTLKGFRCLFGGVLYTPGCHQTHTQDQGLKKKHKSQTQTPPCLKPQEPWGKALLPSPSAESPVKACLQSLVLMFAGLRAADWSTTTHNWPPPPCNTYILGACARSSGAIVLGDPGCLLPIPASMGRYLIRWYGFSSSGEMGFHDSMANFLPDVHYLTNQTVTSVVCQAGGLPLAPSSSQGFAPSLGMPPSSLVPGVLHFVPALKATQKLKVSGTLGKAARRLTPTHGQEAQAASWKDLEEMSQPKAPVSCKTLSIVCNGATNRDGFFVVINPCDFTGQIALVVPEEILGHRH